MWARLTSGARPVDEADRRLARMLFAVLYGRISARRCWVGCALGEARCTPGGNRESGADLARAERRVGAAPRSRARDIRWSLHARYLGVELSASVRLSAPEKELSRLLHRSRAHGTGASSICSSSRSTRPRRPRSTCVTATSRSTNGGFTGSRRPGPRASPIEGRRHPSRRSRV